MRASEFIVLEYRVDNDINSGEGLGTTGYNSNVEYRGLRILMRPSVFLSLALPLNNPLSVEHIKQHMQSGGALGSPFLIVDIPYGWLDNDEEEDFTQTAKIVGHEGRNRMLAIQALEGDEPCEVHLFPHGEVRARHLTSEIVSHLQSGLVNQAKTKIIVPEKDSVLFSII